MRWLSQNKDERGVALVVVVLALVVVTAFVVEFAYAVYVDMNLLNNWREGRRLAAMASSGAALAAEAISQYIDKQSYTYPGYMILPSQDVFDDGTLLSVSLFDESGKFNLNNLVDSHGVVETRYHGFQRMLDELELNPDIADMVVDWIDEDSIPIVQGAEEGARNGPMATVDELMLIPGIDRKTYDKLKPYVTVHGTGIININAADPVVIMTLSSQIDLNMAERVDAYRQSTPFKTVGDIRKVAGFEELWKEAAFQSNISVKASMYSITTTAASADGLSRTVDCVIEGSGLVKYWKEY